MLCTLACKVHVSQSICGGPILHYQGYQQGGGGGAHAMQYNKDEDVIKTSVFHLETV